MKRNFPFSKLITLLLVTCALQAFAKNETGQYPVSDFAVASAHPLATQAGIDILAQGGNAFDAAVAVTATLAVVEPYSSGLGGGGFWLLHVAKDDLDVMLDGRETAPLAATRDMYLDQDGEPTQDSVTGPLAAGIPGVPAGIVHLSRKYGQLPLHTTLDFAIQKARNGFAVSPLYQKLATRVLGRLRGSPQASAIFLDDGEVPKVGYILRQPQLAEVLERLRDFKEDGFYTGEVAQKLVAGVQQAGGIWQLDDLKQYRVKERHPIVGRYKNVNVVSAALPSSGGIVLMQMLNMLSKIDTSALDATQRTHTLDEIMRRAYSDRAYYLGDGDHVTVPIERLLSASHAEKLLADFDPGRATASQNYLPGNAQEGQDTTHFSIIDQEGNYVAATLSINYPFGSGFVPGGSGVLLNNEMDDFVVKPGHPNLWGLVGSEANAIAPRKRMLSSMSPTFIDDGHRIAILGTPGGSRIITMVLLSTLAFIDGADAKTMVELPRFHHQFLPDQIQFEAAALSPATRASLTAMGHALMEVQQDYSYGNMHAIIWEKQTNRVTAASDPRGLGSAQVGEQEPANRRQKDF